MTAIQLNFNGVKPAGEFTPLDGQFMLTIDKAETKMSKGDDPTLRLNVQFKTEDGVVVWHNMGLEGDQLPFTLAFLNAVYATNLEEEGEVTLDPSDLTSRKVIANIVTEPHWKNENQMQNNIKSFEPAA